MVLQGGAGCIEGYRRSRVQRVAVDPGRDRGKRDASATARSGELDRPPVAGRKQLGLAGCAAAPDRAHRVDDVFGVQPPGARDLGVARGAAAVQAALLEDLRSGGAMNRTVDASSSQARVGRVDDRVRSGVRRDVTEMQRDGAQQVSPLDAPGGIGRKD